VASHESGRATPWWRPYVADPVHGPLPALLLVLTVVTGLIDAVSILSLGRVFVANMTGNVVFIGFALARAPGFSLEASVVALAGFLVGAAIGGVVVRRFGHDRGVLLRNTTAVECVLILIAAVTLATASRPIDDLVRDVTVGLIAIALGMQNASVRRLAVPDATTTVLTMTLTGIAADLRSGNWQVAIRRVLAVLAMLLGALAGALLVMHVNPQTALFVAAALTAVVAAGVSAATRRPASWRVLNAS
jgi:uncharacterized membrane protein YoaK (UPF0700 family)